jgi:hypothetical protein
MKPQEQVLDFSSSSSDYYDLLRQQQNADHVSRLADMPTAPCLLDALPLLH